MFYSEYVDSETIYEKDSDGNILYYTDSDGNKYPIEAGASNPHYAEPKQFKASISSNLNELHAREFGVDQSSIYSTICVDKGYLPSEFTFGTLVWKDSPIRWKDEINKIPDETSADYSVKGILTEFINNDWYLLQRINNE